MRKTGRPLQPVIKYDEAIDAALAIIDEHGIEGLSMRNLAKELQINASSLYHHFKNKDEILDGVARRAILSGNIPQAKPSQNWDDSLIAMISAYRKTLVKHPNITLRASRMNVRQYAHDNYEAILKNFRDAGIEPADALFYMATLEILAVGSAILEASNSPTLEMGPIDAKQHPLLAKATTKRRLNFRTSFKRMCKLFLLGLEPPGSRSK